MRRFMMVAIATVVGTNAGAQELLFNPQPIYKVSRTLEGITGQPSAIVVPLNRPMEAPSLSALPYQPKVVKKTVLRDEPGGRIDMHRMRFSAYNASGDDIEIRGMCFSACTLVMGIIPADRICFSAQGFLAFHKASNRDGTVSMEYTLDMIASYPTGIQKWIEQQGGAAKMPHWEGRWVLAAPDLWKMGYRKCPD